MTTCQHPALSQLQARWGVGIDPLALSGKKGRGRGGRASEELGADRGKGGAGDKTQNQCIKRERRSPHGARVRGLPACIRRLVLYSSTHANDATAGIDTGEQAC